MLASLVANVPTPPSTFDGVPEAIAVFVLLLVFVMLRQALLHSQLRLYALQSLAVSALAAVLATSEQASDLFVLAGLSLVLKVIIVPIVILHLLREAEVDVAGSQRFGVASAVLRGPYRHHGGTASGSGNFVVGRATAHRRRDCDEWHGYIGPGVWRWYPPSPEVACLVGPALP